MPNSKGFTLIELLITISIIAILAAIGLVVYSYAIKQGRDSKRQSDLRSIQSTLEQYNSDQFFYPSGGLPFGTAALTSSIGNPNPPSPTKTYMNSTPNDSDSTAPYMYTALKNGVTGCDNSTSNQCNSYCLYAYLEIPPSPALSLPSGCIWPIVSGKTYNFVVTPP